jgi:D-glutamate N-acetyltransferase
MAQSGHKRHTASFERGHFIMMSMTATRLELPYPYLLFLGDTREPGFAKTAYGLRDWAPQRCVGEWSCKEATVTTGLPRLTPKEAYARGARGLVIGVANIGGVITEAWIPLLLEALDAGLDIVSGMHARLHNVEALRRRAQDLGRNLIDVRVPTANIPVGTGRKRSGQRLLTVGTDCALGKKYSALALTRAFLERDVDADFRATGQTGILIAGSGIPMDAVVADFTAGAAEMLSPDAAASHWDVIEGQGSLFHPAYAGVSLGLLHGSQPDVIVVCHTVGRTQILGAPGYSLPTLEETIELNLRLGRRTNPAIRCAGVCLNTSELDAAAAQELLETQARRLNLPVADPIRGGTALRTLVDACLGIA